MRDGSADVLARVQASLDRALATDVLPQDMAEVLGDLRRQVAEEQRNLVIVEMTDDGRQIAGHINSRFGTDGAHGLIGQHLHDLGYRLAP